MTTLEVSLLDEQVKALEVLARARNESVGTLVQDAVEKFIRSAHPAAREEATRPLADIVNEVAEKFFRSAKPPEKLVRPIDAPDWEERKRRALSAAGRFNSRTGDLSARHDEYFADSAEEKEG